MLEYVITLYTFLCTPKGREMSIYHYGLKSEEEDQVGIVLHHEKASYPPFGGLAHSYRSLFLGNSLEGANSFPSRIPMSPSPIPRIKSIEKVARAS